MTKTLILLHVLAGSVAVGGMLIAWATEKGGQWHRYGGRAFSAGMLVSLSLGLIVSVLTRNVFLFSIALFSGYMVYTGWRIAKVRNGKMSSLDRFAFYGIAITSGLMLAVGAWMLSRGDTMGIVQIVFGFLSGGLALQDYRFKGAWPRGKERIVLHVGRMGGATIATITAVLVTNVQTQPQFLGWLLPSVVVTPLIIYWTRRVQNGRVASS